MYKKYFYHIKQIILSEIGIKGQDKINKTKVLCIGTGGLGSPVITYLLATGIKNIGLSEFDKIDESNLNRQFIFKKNNIGEKKIKIAKTYIKDINKNINLKTHGKINHSNCIKIIKNYDLIIECTDNYKTKLIISDCAIKLNISLIHASVFGFEGYITTIKKGYCYRCLKKNYSISKYTDYGILGAVAGAIGCIQIIETIKNILNIYKNELIFFDFKNNIFKKIKLSKIKKCTICKNL